MNTESFTAVLAKIFAELTTGAAKTGGFVLNGGDPGLPASRDTLTAADASSDPHGGATIAAHTEHIRFGLSLMNHWATEGGNPFAGARWCEAWTTTTVDETRWKAKRDGCAPKCSTGRKRCTPSERWRRSNAQECSAPWPTWATTLGPCARSTPPPADRRTTRRGGECQQDPPPAVSCCRTSDTLRF